MKTKMTGVAALAAIAVLSSCSNDDPAATPRATTDEPTTPSSTSTADCQAVGYDRELDPGCWAIQASGLPDSPLLELDLPAGFVGNAAWVWVNDVDEWGAITLLPVGDVHPDPCTRAGSPPKVGPSVMDFATALAAQEVTTSTIPVPVSLGGHDGVYLEVSVPAGFDPSGCRGKELSLWKAEGEDTASVDASFVSRFWVLGVNRQRVVLVMNTHTDAPEKTVAFFTDIVESATFAEG
jgi:hypothetical protein